MRGNSKTLLFPKKILACAVSIAIALTAIATPPTATATQPSQPMTTQTNISQSLARPESRVIGGHRPSHSATPWFVLLRIHDSVSYDYEVDLSCGGTAISQRWVLTAAHCVYGSSPSDLNKSELSVNPKTNTLTNPIGIEQVIVHPSYNQSGLAQNDLALIKTTQPMNTTTARFSGNKKGPTKGTSLDVYGFGVTSPTSTATNYLLTARIRDLGNPSGSCKSWKGLKPASQICAGMPTKPVGACQGDSGGPLMSTYPASRRIVVGVVGGGASICTSTKYPGLYSRVSAFAGWIQQKTGITPTYGRVNKPAILKSKRPCKTRVCKRKRGQTLTVTIKNVGNETGKWKVTAPRFAKARSSKLHASKSVKVRYKVKTKAKRCVTVRVRSGKKTIKRFKLAVNKPRRCR